MASEIPCYDFLRVIAKSYSPIVVLTKYVSSSEAYDKTDSILFSFQDRSNSVENFATLCEDPVSRVLVCLLSYELLWYTCLGKFEGCLFAAKRFF